MSLITGWLFTCTVQLAYYMIPLHPYDDTPNACCIMQKRYSWLTAPAAFFALNLRMSFWWMSIALLPNKAEAYQHKNTAQARDQP